MPRAHVWILKWFCAGFRSFVPGERKRERVWFMAALTLWLCFGVGMASCTRSSCNIGNIYVYIYIYSYMYIVLYTQWSMLVRAVLRLWCRLSWNVTIACRRQESTEHFTIYAQSVWDVVRVPCGGDVVKNCSIAMTFCCWRNVLYCIQHSPTKLQDSNRFSVPKMRTKTRTNIYTILLYTKCTSRGNENVSEHYSLGLPNEISSNHWFSFVQGKLYSALEGDTHLGYVFGVGQQATATNAC